MKFKYEFEKESGVKVDYWVIDEIRISPLTGKAEAKLLGYLNQEAFDAGKVFEVEHHVSFVAEKEDSKFTDLISLLAGVIENKLIADRA